MDGDFLRRAELLRDQVKRTWDPPRKGRGCDADMAQTAVMQTLAFVLGPAFLGELTINQHVAVVQGLALMNREFGTSVAFV